MTVLLHGSGITRTLGELPPCYQGHKKTTRASFIVPLSYAKRIAFRLLRVAFGGKGAVAEWTRNWRGPWLCWLIGERKKYVNLSRRKCVRWEKQQLLGKIK